jgi:DnaK suppressor protein
MKQTEKTQVLNYLINEKSKLIKHLDELVELTKPIEPDCAIGRVSRMDAINNKSVNEAGLRKKIEQLNGLEYALSIFDDNDLI